MSSLKIEDLAEILNPLKGKYEVVLYGSQVEGGIRPDSDIDIAVITRGTDIEKNIKIQKELLGIFSLKFDIRVFELFPIYIQISIIENYQVVFGDILEISEYFYSFRKKWDDCKHRILSNQFSSHLERLNLIK
ncbi:MAG: nucleotidyltransferase domain-containing protein [Candidatus Lokiarchaeota archaeon]|nr:nucleotidyltransferase domain-containing protein [Candidatus Lokiarchaeota archaeon]